MTYQYEPTKAEQRAAALLRKKGWRVDEPPCPECHGIGYVWHGEAWGDPRFGGGTAGAKPCSYGCPLPVMFFPYMTIPQSATSDWPLCTCPKGNYTGDWICARHSPQNNTTGLAEVGREGAPA